MPRVRVQFQRASQSRSPVVSDGPENGLIARALGGDRDALAELLGRHGPELRRQLSGKIASRWRSLLEVNDVLQVTYLEAFLRIGQYKNLGPGSFLGWLSSIARNNLTDAVKSLERAKRYPAERRVLASNQMESSVALWERLVATSGTPSRHAAAHEIHYAVVHAVDQLPADYARVLQLYDLQGQSVTEVATAMKRTVGAVYMLRSRALDRLRETLGSASGYFSRS